MNENLKGISGYLHYAGSHYWTASLLPALVGTTLPFWLRPRGFSFKWPGALGFLSATVLFHAGFSFLHARVQNRISARWSKTRLLRYGGICILIACLLGLLLNTSFVTHFGVPGFIFVVYGLSALFAGMLYVIPPFSFYRRVGGEVIIAIGLGMIPVLGAYLVQVGDLTRTVYLASLPLVVATGLWVWLDELSSFKDDEETGRETLVLDFGPRFSGRFGVPMLIFLFFATLFLAVLSGSLISLTLVLLLFVWHFWRIVTVSWNEYEYAESMAELRKHAFTLHFATGSILAASSLVPLFK